MKKLLSMIGVLSFGVTSISPIINFVESNSKVIIDEFNSDIYMKNNSEYATMDLNDVELETTSINVSKHSDKLEDEEAMLSLILQELTLVNKKNKILPQIIKSTKKNYDDWFVVLPQFPKNEGEKVVDDLWMMYMGDDNAFEGYLIVEDLEFTYESKVQKPHLSTVIKNSDIGKVQKLNEDAIVEAVVSINGHEIDKEDFYVESLSYEKAVLRASANSKYQGSVMITFNDVFANIGDIETDPARTDAYNSEQTSQKTAATIIDIDLGKTEFLKSYSYMDYTLTTNYYAQGMGRFDYVVDKDHPTVDKTAETYKDKSHYKPRYQRINLNENTSISTFDLLYKNVNQERAYGTLTVNWLNDFKLEIRATVNTYSWSTAWNAQWARAEARMGVSNIKFS
ncbi:hypothetical protein [Spiroplasma monobiae]|uniref:Uncharacterized protein n=1 Tax=Spiroplasma monobiae MQ-1 TaxID=1336748 RepID=A0A2K9LUU5_SPISQ|nr:hypothetical protein [Spiroplasma monobiae]AUM62819.1 hypothetical protein SMONO_v1c05700 [Spiroplasma monobiae MQ-1]